jgi:hypothetical protein
MVKNLPAIMLQRNIFEQANPRVYFMSIRKEVADLVTHCRVPGAVRHNK